MEKTHVYTATLEEKLVEDFTTILPSCVYEEDPGVKERVKTLVEEFRTKFEDECFEVWRIAQAFERDEKYSRYLDDKRVLDEMRAAFRTTVGAYNREREKEGKPDHKFSHPALPKEEECVDSSTELVEVDGVQARWDKAKGVLIDPPFGPWPRRI